MKTTAGQRPDRPIVVLAGRHRPHELMLLGISIITGVSYLVGSPRPNSLAAELPHAVFTVWAASMLLSGAAGLFGCLIRREPLGLELERGALSINAGAVILYTAVLVAYGGGWRAFGAALIAAAWAGANLARSIQITRDLRQLRP